MHLELVTPEMQFVLNATIIEVMCALGGMFNQALIGVIYPAGEPQPTTAHLPLQHTRISSTFIALYHFKLDPKILCPDP